MTKDELFEKAVDILSRTYLDTRTELKIRLDIAKFIKELRVYREGVVENEA